MSLHTLVLCLELIEDGRAFGIGFVCQVLSSLDVIEFISEDGKDASRPGAVHLHFLEHRCKVCESSLGSHGCQELEECAVGILLQGVGELLDIESCNLCKLCGVLEHFGEEVLYSGCCGLILLHVLVENRCETHNLSLCEACLLADTCHTGGEVNEIAGRGRGILSQFIDSRTCRQHGTSQTFGLVFAEHLSELTDLRDGFITEVITEGDIDLIGSVNKIFNCSSRGDAEPAGIFG